eukprot:g33.t1
MGIWDHRGLGRIFISLIFIVAGATQINEWEEMRKVVWQKMVDHGYESTGMPPLLLGCAVSLQLVGGLAVLVTLIMHNPVVDKSFHSEQFTHFMKNLSILGGLMVLASCGDAPTAGRVAEGAVEGAHAGRGAHRSGIKKRS